MMIAIVDYQTGNLNSISNMLKKIGAPAIVTSDPAEIVKADKLIIPGVGAFDAGMSRLQRTGLVPLLNERVLTQKTPILGICLGMQLMTRGSEEGALPGLGWIDAETRRFDKAADPDLKIPHMGWNVARPVQKTALVADAPPEPRFYFVHSFYVACDNSADRLLASEYGRTRFDAGVQHENVMGVQFHPEKSHRYGMWLLKNFAERC